MKRKHIYTMKAVLKTLADGEKHSYGNIERKANTNWQTVRDHVKLLEIVEAVDVLPENKVKITEKGLKILKKI